MDQITSIQWTICLTLLLGVNGVFIGIALGKLDAILELLRKYLR
jgi:hypothetical protein